MSVTRQGQPLGSVLVTGGCGFLGSHIVRLLLEEYSSQSGTSITVLDLHTNRNVLPGVEYVSGDLTNASNVRSVFARVKPNVVIHTASPVFSSGGAKTKELMYNVNVEGTRTLIEESKAAGVKAFVYTSSASVVSDTRTDLINADERWSLIRGKLQMEYYSDTKAEAEELALAANAPQASPPFLTTALRPSAMFGEQDVQMIPNMLNVLKTSRTAFQLGENHNLFDFTYVGNVAHAHVLAAKRLLEEHTLLSTAGKPPIQEQDAGKVDGEAFVITNTTPIYFWDFARSVWWKYHQLDVAAASSMASPRSKPLSKPPAKLADTRILSDGLAIFLATLASIVFTILRLGEPKLTPARVRYSCMTRYFKTSKAEQALGYAPKWDLDQGIERTVKWFWERDQEESVKKAQ